MNDYKQLAYEYEVLNSREDIYKQKDFFKRIIEKYNIKSSLDCACGLGWHLEMLDELGVKCYGSDISSDMISLCKENLMSKNIVVKVEDYKKLNSSWDIKFDMIICVTSAINHMLEDKDIIEALKSMNNRLSDNGILVIASGVSDALIINKPKLIPAKLYSDKAVYFFLEYLDDKVIFNIFNIRKTEASFEHSLNSMTLSLISKKRLEYCSLLAGFKIIELFGDFEFNEYIEADMSKRLIMLLKKTPN